MGNHVFNFCYSLIVNTDTKGMGPNMYKKHSIVSEGKIPGKFIYFNQPGLLALGQYKSKPMPKTRIKYLKKMKTKGTGNPSYLYKSIYALRQAPTLWQCLLNC